MIARLVLLCLLAALTGRGETALNLTDLPDNYVCFVFALELESKEFSRSRSRHELHVVDGPRWRIEVISEEKSGFVATYDARSFAVLTGRSTVRRQIV
jgi:hypothetical protein